MSALLTIDTMAQRYGILPSELLLRASTFDLFICNSSIRYQQVKQAEKNGDFSHYSVEQLEAIRNQV